MRLFQKLTILFSKFKDYVEEVGETVIRYEKKFYQYQSVIIFL